MSVCGHKYHLDYSSGARDGLRADGRYERCHAHRNPAPPAVPTEPDAPTEHTMDRMCRMCGADHRLDDLLEPRPVPRDTEARSQVTQGLVEPSALRVLEIVVAQTEPGRDHPLKGDDAIRHAAYWMRRRLAVPVAPVPDTEARSEATESKSDYDDLGGDWSQEDIDFILNAPEVIEPAKALIYALLRARQEASAVPVAPIGDDMVERAARVRALLQRALDEGPPISAQVLASILLPILDGWSFRDQDIADAHWWLEARAALGAPSGEGT